MSTVNADRGTAEYCILALLYTLASVVIGYRISQPEMLYFDEVFFVPSAREMLAGISLGEITHPPLGKLLIAASIRAFGDTPFAWRLPGLLSGIVLVGLVFQLLRELGASRGTAVLGGGMVLFDGLCLTQARAGLLNAPCVALAFGALLCAKRKRPLCSGALLGFSCACKFVGFAFAPLVLFVLTMRNSHNPCPKMQPMRRIAGVMLVAALVAYLLAFAPVQSIHGSFWKGIALYHGTMFEHHLMQATLPHRYESPWWSWPLSLRPIWYGFEAIPGTSLIRGVLCLANPLTSICVLLAVGVGAVKAGIKRRLSRGEWIAMAGFSLHLLPWAFSPRLTMYHYYYPALLFGVMLFCLQIDSIKPGPRVAVMTVVGLALGVMFLYWYPLWTALPIPRSRYESMLWFQGWT